MKERRNIGKRRKKEGEEGSTGIFRLKLFLIIESGWLELTIVRVASA